MASRKVNCLIKIGAGALALSFSALCSAQQLNVRGTCEVKVTGSTNLEFSGRLPAPEAERVKSAVTNYLWLKALTAEVKAKSPQAAQPYEMALQQPTAVFGLSCSSGARSVVMSALDGGIDGEEFAAKPGTYPLLGSTPGGEQPPGFFTVLSASENGAFVSLSPSEPGRLTITTLTETEFAGEFQFESGDNRVQGSFDFERIP